MGGTRVHSLQYVLPRSKYRNTSGECQSTTHLVCTGRMIVASTNYQTGHRGVAFATLAACLRVILGRPVAQEIEWEKAKKGLFCEVCHGRSELPVHPANYDKMRLLGLHIACQYGVHINIACIIRSLVCCCCYDLKFTLAEYFKPTIEDIFHVFVFCFLFFLFLFLFLFLFFRKKMKSPCPLARLI